MEPEPPRKTKFASKATSGRTFRREVSRSVESLVRKNDHFGYLMSYHHGDLMVIEWFNIGFTMVNHGMIWVYPLVI